MGKAIKILGTGCPKCRTTIALLEKVVNENKIDVKIIKVDDIIEIMGYNVQSTPVLVIDEKITLKGRLSNKNEIIDLLK